MTFELTPQHSSASRQTPPSAPGASLSALDKVALPDGRALVRQEVTKLVLQTGVYESWKQFMAEATTAQGEPLAATTRDHARHVGVRFLDALLIAHAPSLILGNSSDETVVAVDDALRNALRAVSPQQIEDFVVAQEKAAQVDVRYVLRRHVGPWAITLHHAPSTAFPQSGALEHHELVCACATYLRFDAHLSRLAADPARPIGAATCKTYRRGIRRFLEFVVEKGGDPKLHDVTLPLEERVARLDALLQRRFGELAAQFVRLATEGGEQRTRGMAKQARWRIYSLLAPVVPGAEQYVNTVERVGARRRQRDEAREGSHRSPSIRQSKPISTKRIASPLSPTMEAAAQGTERPASVTSETAVRKGASTRNTEPTPPQQLTATSRREAATVEPQRSATAVPDCGRTAPPRAPTFAELQERTVELVANALEVKPRLVRELNVNELRTIERPLRAIAILTRFFPSLPAAAASRTITDATTVRALQEYLKVRREVLAGRVSSKLFFDDQAQR